MSDTKTLFVSIIKHLSLTFLRLIGKLP